MTIDNNDDEVEISSTPGMSSKHKKDKLMDLSKLAYKFSFAIGEQCMVFHSLGDSEHARTAPKSAKECSRNRGNRRGLDNPKVLKNSEEGANITRSYFAQAVHPRG